MHVKYWNMYLLMIVMLIPGHIISLLLAWFAANLVLDEWMAWLMAMIVGGAIISLPLLSNNYKVACKARDLNMSRVNIKLLTFLNHIPSLLLGCVIFVLTLYGW